MDLPGTGDTLATLIRQACCFQFDLQKKLGLADKNNIFAWYREETSTYDSASTKISLSGQELHCPNRKSYLKDIRRSGGMPQYHIKT